MAMHRVTLLLLIALAACDDDPQAAATTDTGDATTADTEPRPDAPTPWIYPADEDPPTPELDLDALESALTIALDAALEVDPGVVRDLHELLFPMPTTGSGDPTGCPFFLTYDYGTAKAFYWQGECTASDGSMFSGSGSVALYDDFQNEAGIFDGFAVTMAGRIEAADGTFLAGSGQAVRYAGGAGDLRADVATLDGTFTAGGPRAPQSPWLDGSRRPSLTVTGFTYVPTGGTSVALAGGLAGLDFPAGVTAVALDELTLRQALAGATCERELGGAAGVRGADGNWYDALFDGALGENAQTPPELCDGCGETWYRGVALGALCLDARTWFGRWESAP